MARAAPSLASPASDCSPPFVCLRLRPSVSLKALSSRPNTAQSFCTSRPAVPLDRCSPSSSRYPTTPGSWLRWDPIFQAFDVPDMGLVSLRSFIQHVDLTADTTRSATLKTTRFLCMAVSPGECTYGPSKPRHSEDGITSPYCASDGAAASRARRTTMRRSPRTNA